MVREFLCYSENRTPESIKSDLNARGYSEIFNSDWPYPLDKLLNCQAIFFEEINIALVNKLSAPFLKNEVSNPFKVEESAIKLDRTHCFSKETNIVPDNWGLKRIKIPLSGRHSQEIRVAILDSGVDCTHEVFNGRKIIHKSFISREVKDFHGHGTFCAALAFGYKTNTNLRIGVAPNTKIFSCKILDEAGEGQQGDIIRGLLWAIRQKCKIVNVSLGYRNNIFKKNDEPTTRVLKYIRKNDCIPVCGIGNDSDRDDKASIYAINFPSSCDGAIAVTAIDESDKIYHNANRAFKEIEQIIHFSAPGVGIYSAWSSDSMINKLKYNFLNGTSYANAYVSGILTLYRQKFLKLNADEVIDIALQNVEPFKDNLLEHPKRDYGLGLINI